MENFGDRVIAELKQKSKETTQVASRGIEYIMSEMSQASEVANADRKVKAEERGLQRSGAPVPPEGVTKASAAKAAAHVTAAAR